MITSSLLDIPAGARTPAPGLYRIITDAGDVRLLTLMAAMSCKATWR